MRVPLAPPVLNESVYRGTDRGTDRASGTQSQASKHVLRDGAAVWLALALLIGCAGRLYAQAPIYSRGQFANRNSAQFAGPTSDLTEQEIYLLRQLAQELAQRQDAESRGNSYATDQIPDGSPAHWQQPALTDQGEMKAPASQSGDLPKFDLAVVAEGQMAFNNSCLDCHDAPRSTEKRKSLSAWMATVQRMAGKDDADISSSEVRPIATYLASLNPVAEDGQAGGRVPAFSLFSTVSLIHRSGVQQDLENPGFFPEIWLGAEWRGTGPLSGRVNLCISCHTENAAQSNRVELAEGFLRLDVDQLLGCCEDGVLQTAIDAGRFVVPFGAFAAKSHPGAFRTATRPLMFNMGQNVYRDSLGPPILPMPYSDEGAMVHSSLEWAGMTAKFSGYAVNGLQGSTALNLAGFYSSRDYVDNNGEPSVGGRVTLGNKFIRGGASITSGRFNAEGNFFPANQVLDYKIYGFDLTARYKDIARVYVEYARRSSDVFTGSSNIIREDLTGIVMEGEIRLWDRPRVSGIVRYDDQLREASAVLSGSPITSGNFGVRRFTWGLNFDIAGTTLMINHERWNVPAPLNDVDLIAIRWVAAF